MKTDLQTKSALVSIFNSKDFDFLYVVKLVNTDLFLPRVQKAVVRDMIKSDGLYNITYRLYTNAKGYDTLYISKAEKVVTK